jgi:3-hydroxyisobutyrate dehydrogenase-like beta-hydroxyacid dehydrogenase
MEKRVGMVGTGLMGGGMAKTLLRAGFAVNVFDVDQARMTSVVEAGANGMDSLPRLVKAQPVVLMSLPGPAQVAEVM